jgi:hypothetical protein
MRGCETVWVPGSDHAGIATQVLTRYLVVIPSALGKSFVRVFYKIDFDFFNIVFLVCLAPIPVGFFSQT